MTYINYDISFRHAEILPKIIIIIVIKFSKIFFFFSVIENEASFGMFKNIQFVKIK